MSMQVAALLADNGAQPNQAQRHLMQQNQGLLRFVEQDYKGTTCPFHIFISQADPASVQLLMYLTLAVL